MSLSAESESETGKTSSGNVQEQELIRRWDSERELFLQHRTCRGQRLRPL